MAPAYLFGPMLGISLPQELSLFNLLMLIRIIIATPPAWEIVLCVAILVVTIAGFIGLLMTGKRFTIKEIVRWVTY